MRAIVLCAGQGKRLLPLTESEPKCLLPVDGDLCALDLQLRAIAHCGIERSTIMIGFGAEQVERYLASHRVPGLMVDTIFNPFYATTDNLITCWLARRAMTGDFLLLNGDTLFEDDVLRTVLDAPRSPISVTVNHKSHYDEDDMKVTLDGDGRLRAIGKTLALEDVHAESIGMLRFRDSGVTAWRSAIERAVRNPNALRRWYLSVVDELARNIEVRTTSITGMWWQEIDSIEDLQSARDGFLQRRDEAKEPVPVLARARSL
ncbi:MAG: sugar phosphate nucleotidyltransferase [Myxococcota bacterium]